MTLPASSPISLGDVLTEIRRVDPGRALPISLGDADVRALAGKPSGAVSLSDLYGKSSYIPMSGSLSDLSMTGVANPGANYTEHENLTISFSGGLAPFVFAWTSVSGNGSVDAINAATTVVNMPVARFAAPGTVTSQVVRCVVTDATGAVLDKQCTVTMTVV